MGSQQNLQQASGYFQIAKQSQGELMRRTERRSRGKAEPRTPSSLQNSDVLSHHAIPGIAAKHLSGVILQWPCPGSS